MGKGRERRKRRKKKDIRKNSKLPHPITGIDYGVGTDFTTFQVGEVKDGKPRITESFDYGNIERRTIVALASRCQSGPCGACKSPGCPISYITGSDEWKKEWKDEWNRDLMKQKRPM